MTRLRRARAAIAWPLVAIMVSLVLPTGFARAALVGTDRIIERSAAADQRARVQSFVERDDVKRKMVELGVDPDEAASRIGSLSDAEAAQLAARIDGLPAGQGAGSAVVLLLVIVILILLLPLS